jgi:hypothetical protein
MATLILDQQTLAGGPARATPAPGLTDPEKLHRLLRRCTLALLAAGVLWRVVRYLLRFPLWGDEAMICLNFLELDYAGLTHQLRYCQVAPLLFLWGELTSLRLLGGSELAMRLLPFLAGTGALALFWRLARLTLPPPAATLALGFLAVAIWPVSMCTFAKPYSLDLFMALVLLLPAAHLLRRPGRLRWLALLCLVTPLAIFGSFPAVFVGGAVSLALLPAAWRGPGWKPRLLYFVYNATLLTSFAGHYFLVGRGQLATPVGTLTTEHGMSLYWADGFLPAGLFPLLKWLLRAHVGQMTAYPIGAQDGGSTLTTLLCLLGAWHFWTSRRRALLVLCAAPFALSFVAAVLHRYPYGASCRLCQFVAPAICLTAGAGAAALIDRVRSARLRRRWVAGVCTVFLLIGAGGMTADVLKPYRDLESRWTRHVMQRLAAETPPGCPVVVLNAPLEVDALFRWYLELYGERLSWDGRIDLDRAAAAAGEVVCVRFRSRNPTGPEELRGAPRREPAAVPPELGALLRRTGRPWVLKQAVTDTGVPPTRTDPVKHLDQFRWVLAR